MASPKANRLRSNLCTQILEYIKDQELDRGAHLTASALATRFNVSRTPVRAALIILKDRGFLQSSHNRGFFVEKPIRKQSDIPEEFQQTEEHRLYMMIADDRLKGVLPDKISEVELLRRYETTRGILIRVLHTLSNEGLARSQQGHGWKFNSVLNSKESHGQSYNFRKIIEPAGILEDSFQIDLEKAKDIRKQHEDLMNMKRVSTEQIFEVNSNFHAVIAAFSGNTFIEDVVQQQNKLRRFVEYSFKWVEDPQEIRDVCLEHLAILDALETGDRKRASNLMWQHLDTASKFTETFASESLKSWVKKPG